MVILSRRSFTPVMYNSFDDSMAGFLSVMNYSALPLYALSAFILIMKTPYKAEVGDAVKITLSNPVLL